jgi:superfamily II DNA/RNA helicase
MTDQEELENSPKIQRAIDELIKQRQQNPNHRAVIYSNYLDAGLKPYARALSQQNIPHAFFTGNINKSVRDQSVKDYNAGKMPVMLVSGAGAEGLDLKNTRLIQMLDPAYNNAKLDQVQGRGIRYKSHEELPEDQRHVHIQKFYSTKPESLLNRWGVGKPSMAMDRYLQAHSDRKTQLMKQINEALQEASNRGPLKMNTKTSAVMQTIQQYGINPTDFKKSGGDFEAGACSCDSHDELEDVLKSIMQRTTDSPRTSGMIIIRIKKMVAQPNDRGDSPDTQDNKTENNETTEKKAHRYSVKSAMNPAISGALGGGAIGAITAGITPSIYRKKDEPPVALRDRLKNMAVAGTIGAGMGAIGGYGIGQEQFNNGYEEGSGNVSQALLESLRRAGFGK